MKKNLLFLFMLVCCATGLFTSCSDNDDQEKVKLPIETDLAGSYLGNLNVKVNGVSGGTVENQKITITKSNKGDNQVALSLKDFTFVGINVGNIEVDPCAVKTIAGGYSFEGKQTIKLVDPIGNAPVSVSGTVKGNKVDITITVKVGAPLNQDVEVTYNGNKLKGTESSEAKITSFTFDNNALITEQPVIDEEKGTVTFKVNDAATAEELKALVPTIVVSDKATVTPATGVAQDFSENKQVNYTVVAEDGTSRIYTVSISGTSNILKYSFEEEWSEKTASVILLGTMRWMSPLPLDIWDTANQGVAALKNPSLSGGALEEKEGYKGKAVKIITQYTKGMGYGMAPAITSGSLFTGKFVFALAVDPKNQLKMTKFGVPYAKKPLTFKGAFKYAAGSNYVDGSDKKNVKENLGEKDEAGLYALLYEAADEKGNDVVLDGTTISDSPFRVALAEVLNTGDTDNKWVKFDQKFSYFDGKTYDPSKKYKIAIVCSSSKNGASFKGAVNSILWVDELEIIGE